MHNIHNSKLHTSLGYVTLINNETKRILETRSLNGGCYCSASMHSDTNKFTKQQTRWTEPTQVLQRYADCIPTRETPAKIVASQLRPRLQLTSSQLQGVPACTTTNRLGVLPSTVQVSLFSKALPNSCISILGTCLKRKGDNPLETFVVELDIRLAGVPST